MPSIQPSSTFARDDAYELIGEHLYSRHGAPNHRQVEALCARLDGGEDALLFSSGLAAFSALVATVPHGASVVVPEVIYHGALLWLERLADRGQLDLVTFDQSKAGAMESAISESRPHLVWIETPVNPIWDVIDIRAAVEASHESGALLAVDVTAAPLTTRPLELGADIAFHSVTKFYNGHSDLTGGVLIPARTNELWDELKWLRTHTGGVMGAFEAWLLLRGMRTLHLRVERSSQNAMAIARALEGHPGVASVLYPSLESHPGHQIAASQMDRGFGSMMSIRVNGGHDAARKVATGTNLFVPATSLGGVESLIEHRTVLEPPDSPVPDDLLRLSIGIEPVDEMIADLQQALDRI